MTELLLYYGANVNEKTKDAKNLIESAQTEPAEILIQHVVKLLSKEEFVHLDVLNSIKNNVKYSLLQKQCQLEIDKMKSERIGNSTILFYDLLATDNPSQLAAFANNEDVLQIFKSKECQEKFPIYSRTLRYQMKKGMWRELLLSKVRNFFHAVANVKENKGLAKLPAFCISKIFGLMPNRDLRTLMRVCNITYHSEISDLKFN